MEMKEGKTEGRKEGGGELEHQAGATKSGNKPSSFLPNSLNMILWPALGRSEEEERRRAALTVSSDDARS